MMDTSPGPEVIISEEEYCRGLEECVPYVKFLSGSAKRQARRRMKDLYYHRYVLLFHE